MCLERSVTHVPDRSVRRLALMSAKTAACAVLLAAQLAADEPGLAALRRQAESGNAQAQAKLGTLYVSGTKGLERNPAQGLERLLKAAAQNHIGAEFMVGALYAQGIGTPQNYPAAVEWFRRAAKQGDPASALYKNNRDGTFTDVTVKAGLEGDLWGEGVAIGDYDGDGWPDLYLTGYGRNKLYRNNHDGTFSDVAEKAGVTAEGWSTSAVWFDYDNDGRLDLVVCSFVDYSTKGKVFCGNNQLGTHYYCIPRIFQPRRNLLFHNNGDGTFSEVGGNTDIGKNPSKAPGVEVRRHHTIEAGGRRRKLSVLARSTDGVRDCSSQDHRMAGGEMAAPVGQGGAVRVRSLESLFRDRGR